MKDGWSPEPKGMGKASSDLKRQGLKNPNCVDWDHPAPRLFYRMGRLHK